MIGAGGTAEPYGNWLPPPPSPQPAFWYGKTNLGKKKKFNQGNENTEKQRKTLKGDQIIIV